MLLVKWKGRSQLPYNYMKSVIELKWESGKKIGVRDGKTFLLFLFLIILPIILVRSGD